MDGIQIGLKRHFLKIKKRKENWESDKLWTLCSAL